MTKLEKLSRDILLWCFDVFPPVYPLLRRGELSRYQELMLNTIRPFVLLNDIHTVDNVHEFYNKLSEEPVDFVMKTMRIAYEINRYIKQYHIPKVRNLFYTIKKHLMSAMMNDRRLRNFIKLSETNNETDGTVLVVMKISYVDEEYVIRCPKKHLFIPHNIKFDDVFDIPEDDDIMTEEIPEDFDIIMNRFEMYAMNIFYNSKILPGIAGRVAYLS